ncbi:hypothetical protein B0J13DRAFT_563770, partial [Dactylonectria estremocensis]
MPGSRLTFPLGAGGAACPNVINPAVALTDDIATVGLPSYHRRESGRQWVAFFADCMSLWDCPAHHGPGGLLPPIPAPSFWDPMMDADVTCLTGDTRLVGPIFKPMIDGVIPVAELVEEFGTIEAGQPQALPDCLRNVDFSVHLNSYLIQKLEWNEKLHCYSWPGLNQRAIEDLRSQTRRINVVRGVDYLVHIPSADEPDSQRSTPPPESQTGIVKARKMMDRGTRQCITQILGSCHMKASVWA